PAAYYRGQGKAHRPAPANLVEYLAYNLRNGFGRRRVWSIQTDTGAGQLPLLEVDAAALDSGASDVHPYNFVRCTMPAHFRSFRQLQARRQPN
ncbi:MAG TPA: hypothetical protein VEJ84_01380, partial [Acidimicrobiales bacterium]|nr:hypothetical protein [Acidimicrobiales bacterium]